MYPILYPHCGSPALTLPLPGCRLATAPFRLRLSLVLLLMMAASAPPLFAASRAPFSIQPNASIADAGDRNPEPRRYPVPGAGTPDFTDDAITTAGTTVNINLATAAELADSLPGIGPEKAQRIVAWRDSNGPFVRVEQLLDVSGIGPRTLEKIRPFIRMDDTVSLEQGIGQPNSADSAVITALSVVLQQLERDRSLASDR